MYKIKCEICGREYESRFKTRICPECKNRPCEVCGKTFEHPWPYDQHCCSAECRSKWINDPKHKAESVRKRDATVRARYGVSNVNELRSVKDKLRSYRLDPEFYAQEKARLAEEAKKPLIRKCIVCGEEFEAYGSQTTCTRDHFRKCVVCGKEFKLRRAFDTRQTCSSECWRKLRQVTVSRTKHICEYCGKEFYSDSSTAKYCPGPHYARCAVCGKEFEVKFTNGRSPENMPRTCSTECGSELSRRVKLWNMGADLQDVLSHPVTLFDMQMFIQGTSK